MWTGLLLNREHKYQLYTTRDRIVAAATQTHSHHKARLNQEGRVYGARTEIRPSLIIQSEGSLMPLLVLSWLCQSKCFPLRYGAERAESWLRGFTGYLCDGQRLTLLNVSLLAIRNVLLQCYQSSVQCNMIMPSFPSSFGTLSPLSPSQHLDTAHWTTLRGSGHYKSLTHSPHQFSSEITTSWPDLFCACLLLQ